MPRPCKPRRIGVFPRITAFRPADIRPADGDDFVRLTLDEYEALRLADHLHLYQEEAARRMTVSRQTFGSIIASARGKTAEALVLGKTLRIDQGAAERDKCQFLCSDCGSVWSSASRGKASSGCPECRASRMQRHSRTQQAGERRCHRRSGACRRKTV